MQKEKKIMFLENDILKLRAIEPEDLDILYKWENNPSIWIHGNTLSPYSKLAIRQYITNSLEQDIYQSKQLRLMVIQKSVGKTIGTIDLYDLDVRNLRAGIGILIDEEHRQNNYASMTLDIIKNYAFSFLNLDQLYAYVLKENVSSLKLFKKSGFAESGNLKNWVKINNKYQDAILFQLIKEQ